jgi:hypothetical protein
MQLPVGLLGYLVFSFCFFGVWCFKEAALQSWATAVKPLFVGLIFVLIAVLLGLVVR